MTKPEDIPSLEALGEDIRKMRDKTTARKPRSMPQGAGLVLRLGVELMSGAFVGVASGYYLDKWLNTSPFLLILCFFLGSAGGFMTVMRTMNMVEKGKE